MKIKSVEVVTVNHPPSPAPRTAPRRPAWVVDDEVANPMSRFPRFKRHRSLYGAKQWPGFAVKVTAEDGTWGLGNGAGRPAAAVISDAFAHILEGEECMAIEKLWDLMFRVSKSFGTVGIATVAISAVDLALWDLAGKLTGKPVYELIGGPVRDRIFTYATGNDVDWYKELGFRGFKLACPYGPADGLEGLRKNEEFVARAREQIGEDKELMLDCWMAFDVEYTVRLAECLRPYRLKWIEECLLSEDLDAQVECRQRLPWQGLATGEHWYTATPFMAAIQRRAVDFLQPDINWCGGATVCQKIVHAAEGAGLTTILHGGGNTPYGQHFTFAQPSMTWMEVFVGAPPGVPLAEGGRLPGLALPQDGYLVPIAAPGFGMDIKAEWLSPFFI